MVSQAFARAIAGTLVAAMVAACVPGVQQVNYDLELTAVRRPADAQRRWGTYTIERSDSGYAYRDSLVQVVVVPLRGEFLLEIENETEYSLELIWDEMAYVGPNGLTSKVTSGETRVGDMGRAQTPTVIPAHARAAEIAVPNDQVVMIGYDHIIRDFVNPGDDYRALEGKQIQLLVPLKVQDTVNEYTFIFELKDIVPPPSADSSGS